jgi:UDP-glucose 4-epimerase
MKILVTGGAGFIGSHTCLALLERGHEVIVADNLSNSNMESLERVQALSACSLDFYCIDICDEKDLQGIFDVHGDMDAVIHFAGLKAVGESCVKPLAYYRNNIGGTLSLLSAMKKADVKKLIFSSSATVYGTGNPMPLKEDMPTSVLNPYGRTKLMIEEILKDLVASDPAWSIALLRYFNPVGAHPSGMMGEDPDGIPNNLMPYISQVAAGKLPELKIFGDDYDTQDGSGVRDYIHVCDLAEGHIKALERLPEDGIDTYNLGTGRGVSVFELLHMFEKVNGVKIPFTVTGRRAGDVAVCYADAGKAERELGWKAGRTIEDMCRDSYRWQTNNPNGYKD